MTVLSTRRELPGPRPLGGAVDALVQKLENCRAGLTSAVLDAGGAEAFVRGLYEDERERLREAVSAEQLHLPEAAREELFQVVDRLVQDVVLPAYVELAARFTRHERNDFYLAPAPYHGLERAGWAAAGAILGGLVVWAPFIPLWSKEWVLVFFLGGLVFPELRRVVELRRYERALNRLVARVEAEIRRVDLGMFLRGPGEAPRLGGGAG